MSPRFLLLCVVMVSVVTPALSAQQAGPASSAPVTVQPGAPGQASKVISPKSATLPPVSEADVSFMQGMVMHHRQAVEMCALIESHTQNPELRRLGARISLSQTDEMKFMQSWLRARNQPVSIFMPGMPDMNMMGDMSGNPMPMMPGMLTPEQMDALRKARGPQFDHLFLTGMIQHHTGALTMVKELFDTPGAGQDANLFNFATDVDNGQRAEIRIMQDMLKEKR